MSVSDFDLYQKRELRRKKMEELVIAVEELLQAMRNYDAGQQHIKLGIVYTILTALKSIKAPPAA